jgi:hypothetical protein
MSSITRIDAVPFLSAMENLKHEVPGEMHSILRWQMGLWVRDIIIKIYGDPKGSLATQKKQGEATVYGDLTGTRKSGALYQVYVESEQKPKHIPGMQAYSMKAKSGAVYFVDEKSLDPNPSSRSFKARHASFRNDRGRVRAPEVLYRMHGGAKVIQTPTVPKDRLHAYVATVQARVGRAKASWLLAYEHFKKNAGMNLLTWSAPAWIQRHSTNAGTFGHVSDRYNPATGHVDLEAGSELLFGDDSSAALDRTWPTRLKDLMGPFAMKRLKGKIEKYNVSGKAA